MDNETIYKILTNTNNIEDNKTKELTEKIKESLLKYKFFDSKILYNADLFQFSCKVNDIFLNKFNIYNSKLLEYINKDTCITCNNKFVKCYGHCLQHIKNVDIISLHTELLAIFNKITDVEKINFKLSIAELMFKIKRSKSISKREIKTYAEEVFNQQKIQEISNKNEEFIINKSILYKELINKYAFTDAEKEKLYKQNNKINFRITYEINDNNLLNVNENIIQIYKLRKLKYEETRLLSFFNNITDIRTIHIDNSDTIVIEILKHNLINRRILYLEQEKTVKINNRVFRSDIFVIIETNNHLLIPIIIEIDEKHHKHVEDIIKNDTLKDIYYISKGVSVIRLEVNNNKISEDNINLIINKLIDVVELNIPIYYFSDTYIENHRVKTGINITQEMLDKHNIK